MKSFNRLSTRPVSLPLSADDIVEFHAARLLLLISLCGVAGRIDGLTKMAKLDFFTRYPEFFETARSATAQVGKTIAVDPGVPDYSVESAMVRHHYGPWDKRYYHVLAHLEAKNLISVIKEKNLYRIALTEQGQQCARILAARPSFAPLVARMRDVKKTFGRKNGTFLKDLIYRLFDEEVGQQPMGEMIRQ